MKKVPKIGMRSFKTAISATLCALIYSLFDRNPTFACIGAVFGMESSIKDSWRAGGNRLIGTIIGGFSGMFFFWVYRTLDNDLLGFQIPLGVYLFVGIIIMILLCQIFKSNGAITAGSVVFFIVMLNTPADSYVSYALNRMLDTGIGVVMSILVNVAIPIDLTKKLLGHDHSDEINGHKGRQVQNPQ